MIPGPVRGFRRDLSSTHSTCNANFALEELATMAPSSRRIAARLQARYPQLPDGVWQRLEVSPAHVAVAVGLMGTVMVAAAACQGLTDVGVRGCATCSYALALAI